MKSAPTSLKNHLLIAMPQLEDEHFAQTLVYLVEHDDKGTMGLVVNRPGGLDLADVMAQLRPGVEPAAHCRGVPIYEGGPVQTERGFVLHPAGPQYQATLALGELALTTSQDVLFAIGANEGPERHLIALGYAGWAPGQLESELAENTWLSCPCDPSILFDVAPGQRLAAAAAQLGVDLNLLARQAGHA